MILRNSKKFKAALLGGLVDDNDLTLPKYHLNFDGVNDKVVVSPSASLNNLPLADFTLEFSMGNIVNTNFSVLLSKASAAAFHGFHLPIFFDSGTCKMDYIVTFDGYSNYAYREITIPDPLGIHHYEVVWISSTKNQRFFIDGLEVSSENFSDGTPSVYDDDSSNSLAIANHHNQYFLGFRLNWMMISNTARHTSNFAPPSLTACPPADANTVLRLALDDGSGTNARDTSGNSNNGTITGAAWEADE